MKKTKLLLIGGSQGSYQSFVTICKKLSAYSTYIYTCPEAKDSLNVDGTYIKGPLGFKDIGLIVEESDNCDAIIFSSDIGDDPDSIKAIEVISSEVKIPTRILQTDDITDILNEFPA